MNFPMVLDENSVVYRALGFPDSSYKSWHVWTLWWYFKKWYEGHSIRKIQSGEEVTQLGGDVVVDKQGRIVYLYRCQRPDDRPTVDQLIGVFKTEPKSRL